MRRSIGLLASSFVLVLASTASAQMFEDISIAPGFMPDPAVATGLAGGERDASQYGSTTHGACVGMIDNTPDHTVTLQSQFDFLRFRVHSEGDTSLVILGPNGSRFCNDDAVGLDPMIEASFVTGEYQVFVGAVSEGFPEYRLEITEIRNSGGAAAAADAPTENYQPITLEANFLPDPAIGTGESGGSRDATEFGSTTQGPCVGMIDTTADHRVTLQVSFDFLRFRVHSEVDTSLVILGPNGARYCNDDTVGLDPAIEGAFPAGEYEVYIGTVGGTDGAYRLEITEMR